jgi:hypothetical protein
MAETATFVPHVYRISVYSGVLLQIRLIFILLFGKVI